MKLENKRTYDDVALFASMLKGGKSVDKFDILIALLLIDDKSIRLIDDENGTIYLIKNCRYTREQLIYKIRNDKLLFEKLNRNLDNIRKYIKKQLKKYNIEFKDVIEIRQDNSVAPSKRTSYYRFLDPDFDLMKMYVPALNQDAETVLTTHIDRSFNLLLEPTLENFRSAFNFQDRYSQSLRDRVIKAIQDIEIDKVPIQALEARKFITTLGYALLLNDPIKIACLLRRYVDFFEARQSIVDLESKSYLDKLVYDCLNVIEKQLGNAVQDLGKISREISRDELFGENEEIFESVIYYLRRRNSHDLLDALFSYGKYCMAMSNYGKAENAFKECLAYYDEDDFSSTVDRLILYNNLANLYGEWYHLTDAEAHIKQSIELTEKCATFLPDAPNYILSMSYNTLASIYAKSYDYDAAHIALDKAIQYILAETNKESYSYDPNIEYHCLALQHNMAFFDYENGDDHALLALELPVWKAILLTKKYPTSENLLLEAILNITYANGLLKIGSTEDALSFTQDALKIYDELCKRSYPRYALAKTYGLQRLADVYECCMQNSKAISILCDAKNICEGFDFSVNFTARVRRIEILNNLSGLLLKEKQYKETISNCEEIIREYKELSAIDYVNFTFEMLKELDNLAIAYYYDGDLSISHTKIQEALACLHNIHAAIGDELFHEWQTKILNDLSIME